MSIHNLGDYESNGLLTKNPGLLRVLRLFDGISNHPRPSKEEAAVRAHLIGIAQEQNWEMEQDDVGNVAFKIPASKGKEAAPHLILQGHMDMVTSKADAKRPRIAEIIDKGTEGDEKGLWMQTKGQNMTLGADNGIGISLAMAAMMDPELEHGPVTILLTVDEETGMTGAKGLDPKLLPPGGGILVNLDSEEGPEYVTIGCAGSTDIVGRFPIGDREEIPEGYELLRVRLTGFPGGHSGVEIDKANGNAIQSLANLLREMNEAADLRLISLEGGTKRNVIPSTAAANIAVPKEKVDQLRKIARAFVAKLKASNPGENSQMTGTLSVEKAQNVKVSNRLNKLKNPTAISKDVHDRVLAAITELPTGPFKSADLEHVGPLVTLSNNLGVVSTKKGENTVELISMARAANIGELRGKMGELMETLRAKGASVEAKEPSAGWLENPDTSPAVALAKEAVRTVIGYFRLLAYHAGLECGITTDKDPEHLSAVSMGPLIRDAHSDKERVSLDSVSQVIQVLNILIKKAAAITSSS